MVDRAQAPGQSPEEPQPRRTVAPASRVETEATSSNVIIPSVEVTFSPTDAEGYRTVRRRLVPPTASGSSGYDSPDDVDVQHTTAPEKRPEMATNQPQADQSQMYAEIRVLVSQLSDHNRRVGDLVKVLEGQQQRLDTTNSQLVTLSTAVAVQSESVNNLKDSVKDLATSVRSDHDRIDNVTVQIAALVASARTLGFAVSAAASIATIISVIALLR